MQRATGKRPKELDLPILPEELLYIWELYFDIKRGSDSVNYRTINDYTQLTGESLTRFELDCLLDIERKRIEVMNG